MRVAVTCDWFLKYAASQSAALARAGAAVVLVCRAHAEEFGGSFQERQVTLDRARSAGVEVVEIPGRLPDLRATWRLLPLRRRLTAFAPQIVHAHDGTDPRALVLLPSAPTVLTLHDPAPHPGQPVAPLHKRWFLQGSRDAWRKRARLIVVHSEALRAEVALRPSQRCVVLPHGMDTVPAALVPPAEPAVALFGRFTPYKGLDVLAAAMPHVWARRPDVQLHLAGGGASQLTLADQRVHIKRGYLPEDEIASFFRRASLAVLPYTQASQTGAGSVAVGHSVPVVVSRVGGLPDLALDASYVVEPGDERQLAGAILRHVDDDVDVRRRVLSEVAGPRSWDAVATKSLRLYESLVDGR